MTRHLTAPTAQARTRALLTLAALAASGVLVAALQQAADPVVILANLIYALAIGLTFVRFGDTYGELHGALVARVFGTRAGELCAVLMRPAYRFFGIFWLLTLPLGVLYVVA